MLQLSNLRAIGVLFQIKILYNLIIHGNDSIEKCVRLLQQKQVILSYLIQIES